MLLSRLIDFSSFEHPYLVAVLLLIMACTISFLFAAAFGWYFAGKKPQLKAALLKRFPLPNYAILWRAISGPPLSLSAAQKLQAKKINEQLKLFGAFCNTLGAGIIAASVLAPFLTLHQHEYFYSCFIWGFFGLLVHVLGQFTLRAMRHEG